MITDAPLRDNELAGLRQKRDSLADQLTSLDNELERTRAAVLASSEQVRSLNRERAVAKREIQDLNNEIHQLKKRREEIEASLHLHGPKYNEISERLRTLTAEKHSFKRLSADIDEEILELTGRIGDRELEIRDAESQLIVLEDAKVGVVMEISSRLKSASLDRDQYEEQLNSVAVEFRDVVSARDETQLAFSELKNELDKQRETIAQLERSIEIAKQVKELKTVRQALRAEAQTREQEFAAAREALAVAQTASEGKKKDLEATSAAIEDMSLTIAELDEEVGAYARARTVEENERAELDASRAAVAQCDERLRELFEEWPRLEDGLQGLAAKLEWIAGLKRVLE